MAESKNNIITHGLSGKIVDLIVFSQRDDKTYLSNSIDQPANMTEMPQILKN